MEYVKIDRLHSETQLQDGMGRAYRLASQHRDDLWTINTELLAALAEVELCCTLAKLASRVGKEKEKKRTDFLRNELERIAKQARAAITKATA